MFPGTLLEAIGFIFILLLFFGLPAAGLIYGIFIALTRGREVASGQEYEKQLPSETAKEFAVDDARPKKLREDERRARMVRERSRRRRRQVP